MSGEGAKYRISRVVREGHAGGRYEEQIITVPKGEKPPEDAVRVADDCKTDRDFVMRRPTPNPDGSPVRVTREADGTRIG